MTGLTSMNLSGNKMTAFYGYNYTTTPQSASVLATIDLSHNQLTTVDYIDTRLPSLRTIDLHNNYLTSTVSSTGRNTAVTTLNLSNNRFTSFDYS